MFDGPWESCMSVRGLDPSECASWVQAWGTVFAILVSVLIAVGVQHLEARRANRSKIEEENRLLRLMGQFVFDVRAKLRHIEELEIPHRYTQWGPINSSIAALRAIPLEKHPVERVAFRIAIALQGYDFMREEYDKIGDSLGTFDEVQKVGNARGHTLTAFFNAEKLIEEVLAKRGSGLLRTKIDFPNGVSICTLEADPIQPD